MPLKNKLISILLSSLILSCSTDIIVNNTKTFDNKSFSINSNTVQNTELTYTGSWVGGTVHQTTTGTINNTSSSLVYSTNWTTINNGASTEGNYTYVNDGTNKQIVDDTSTSITYTRGNWLTYSAFKYNDIPTSSKYVLTNQDTDINKIKYMYNGAYNVGPNSTSPKEEPWSSSTMHLAWKTLTSSDGLSYTESKDSKSKIEIPFTGTNIQIFQYKTPQMGQCSIKVFDSNDNELRSLTVNNNNATWLLSKTLLNGLPNGNNKLVIQGIDGNRFNFVRAEVMPSIEYKFTGNNINYNAFTANNCGKVAVTIDNDSSTTEIVDLYDSRNIYQNVFNKKNIGNGQHTITIDGLQEKNASSSGFRINVNDFNAVPSVRGEFSGTFLNLKLVGTPNSGKADLYIDGTLNREVDMYSASSSFYSINISGLSDTSHTFELRAKNTKHESSTGTRLNFDGYTTNKASYTFTGTGVKYFADKNTNQGFVDVWVDGTKHGTYNLYSSSLQVSQEIVNITGLTNGEHTIDLIPTGIKSWNSTGYGVNVDYLSLSGIDNVSTSVSFGTATPNKTKSVQVSSDKTDIVAGETANLTAIASDNPGNQVNDKWTWSLTPLSPYRGHIEYSGTNNLAKFTAAGTPGTVTVTGRSSTGKTASIELNVLDSPPSIVSFTPNDTNVTVPSTTDTIANISQTSGTFTVNFEDLNGQWAAYTPTMAYERNITWLGGVTTNIPPEQADNYDIYVGGFTTDTFSQNYISGFSRSFNGNTMTINAGFVGGTVSGYIIFNARQDGQTKRRHRWNIN